MKAQDLKNAILQIAMQGKLVEQRIEEGTAKELITKFGINEAKNDVEVEIPESWCWAFLSDLTTIQYGFPFDSKHFNETQNGMPVIRIRDIISGHSETYSDEVCDERYRIKHGDMLVGMDGNFQVAFWNSEDAWLNQRVCKITSNATMLNQHYLYYYLPIILAEINGSVSYSTVKHLSAKILDSMILPLPPLAEQERIVEKIEELMPMVEEYGKAEEQLTALNTEFPDKLRKSIFQQAIQGKLTERDPADEPAAELLKRIRAEKEKLIKEGKVKKEKPLPPITEDEIPFEIPENWEWIRLSQVITGTDAGKSPQCEERPCNCNEYGVIKTTAIQNGYFLPNENKVLPQSFQIQDNQFLHQGDLLITRAGPKNRTGIMCVVDSYVDNLILSDKTVRIMYMQGMVNPYYIMMALNSPKVYYYVTKAMTGMAESQVNISQSKMKEFILPLPPLAEQERIVDRANELLAMCDELKGCYE